MNTSIIMTFMGIMYSMILRPLLEKAIADPDEEWDDMVLMICDRVFNYKDNPSSDDVRKTRPE